jgi:hypothetical protein
MLISSVTAPAILPRGWKPLGLVEQLAHIARLGRKGARGDLFAHAHQAPQHRAVAHDFRISADVCRRGRGVREADQVLQAAHLDIALLDAQLLKERHDIDRLGVSLEADHLLEDDAVVRTIEIIWLEDVRHDRERVVVKQDSAQHALLAFNRLRRTADSVHHGIAKARCFSGGPGFGNRPLDGIIGNGLGHRFALALERHGTGRARLVQIIKSRFCDFDRVQLVNREIRVIRHVETACAQCTPSSMPIDESSLVPCANKALQYCSARPEKGWGFYHDTPGQTHPDGSLLSAEKSPGTRKGQREGWPFLA